MLWRTLLQVHGGGLRVGDGLRGAGFSQSLDELLLCIGIAKDDWLVGPASAAEALRTALAVGADDAIHLDDPAFEGLDEIQTAGLIAAAIKSQGYDQRECVPQGMGVLLSDSHGKGGIILSCQRQRQGGKLSPTHARFCKCIVFRPIVRMTFSTGTRERADPAAWMEGKRSAK
ncbi:MAG: hypothetical protein HUU16_15875 [Candidatus Omnitrophica bacterium]|nr:hypothetical protein [Candidatus Omnitrophota bacterium]